MSNDDTLAWSTPYFPINWALLPEGRRPLILIVVVCTLVFLGLGLFLAFETQDLFPLFLMFGIAVAAAVCTLGAIFLVFLVYRLAGSGYSYRLDRNGLAYKLCLGKGRPPPPPIPANFLSEGASPGAFDGWVAWNWLRENAATMEVMEKRGIILLRGGGRAGKKMPPVYLFCADGGQIAAARDYIARRLG